MRDKKIEQVNSDEILNGLYAYADADASREYFREIVENTDANVIDSLDENKLTLHLTKEGLSLERNGLSLMGDFTQMLSRLKHNNLSHELLVKASKIKNASGPLLAVDATAGLGEDSILLAAAGFNVIMFEYDTVIAQLLYDTLERSRNIEGLSEIVDRMTLICGDSIQKMGELSEEVDVVLLDPMFPSRQKSGLIKKKFQLLQQLEQPCCNEGELLDAAIKLKPRRVIIKRPQKGPFLAERKPDYTISGKAIRYDCIVVRTT